MFHSLWQFVLKHSDISLSSLWLLAILETQETICTEKQHTESDKTDFSKKKMWNTPGSLIKVTAGEVCWVHNRAAACVAAGGDIFENQL
jgi:hypothetical protein